MCLPDSSRVSIAVSGVGTGTAVKERERERERGSANTFYRDVAAPEHSHRRVFNRTYYTTTTMCCCGTGIALSLWGVRYGVHRNALKGDRKPRYK